MEAIQLIALERRRQIEKGYDAAHDDTHKHGEIAEAAERIIHAVQYPGHPMTSIGPVWYPSLQHPSQWHLHIIAKWKHDPIRMLTIAAALLAAEIERLDRLASTGLVKGKVNRGK